MDADTVLQLGTGLFGLAIVFLIYSYTSDDSAPLPGELKPLGEVVLNLADVGGKVEGAFGVPDETARDFKRSFLAGGVTLMTTAEAEGNQGPQPLDSTTTGMQSFSGDVNKEATNAALKEFNNVSFIERDEEQTY